MHLNGAAAEAAITNNMHKQHHESWGDHVAIYLSHLGFATNCQCNSWPKRWEARSKKTQIKFFMILYEKKEETREDDIVIVWMCAPLNVITKFWYIYFCK